MSHGIGFVSSIRIAANGTSVSRITHFSTSGSSNLLAVVMTNGIRVIRSIGVPTATGKGGVTARYTRRRGNFGGITVSMGGFGRDCFCFGWGGFALVRNSYRMGFFQLLIFACGDWNFNCNGFTGRIRNTRGNATSCKRNTNTDEES